MTHTARFAGKVASITGTRSGISATSLTGASPALIVGGLTLPELSVPGLSVRVADSPAPVQPAQLPHDLAPDGAFRAQHTRPPKPPRI